MFGTWYRPTFRTTPWSTLTVLVTPHISAGMVVATVLPTYRAAFSGDPRNVPLARSAIASFARLCGFSSSEVDDIRLATGEALNNAVEHGRAERSSGFSVHCSFDEGELLVEIHDNGYGFIVDEAHGRLPADDAPRGYGIFLMRRLMDEVRYDHDGTRVLLRRRLAEADR